VPADVIAAFRELPVANASDSMGRMFAGGASLRPIHQHCVAVAGSALTVRTRPGDNLMVHHAVDMAEPGDVIVVDAGGDLTTAVLGDIMISLAMQRGVEAIVINGAIRDADEIRKMGFPLYAAGVTHRGPYKDGPGEINTAINLGGMIVMPGDLVLGDGDGILVIPQGDAQTVLDATRKKHAAEAAELAAIADGKSDRRWVLETLKTKGCEFLV
jgi:RraA family protein